MSPSAPSPEARLDAFLAKYEPEIADQAREVLDRMRARLPGAVQMVYDNYNGLVIGFGPTERPSEALFSVFLNPRWVTLCFLKGATLADPRKVLRGEGNQVRHIRLEEPADLDRPALRDLVTRALRQACWKPAGDGPGPLIIKSISAKQRPRRPD